MKRLIWLALLGAAGSFGAQAQEFDNRWSISAMGGGAVTDSSELDEGVAFSAAIGRALMPRLVLEGQVSYIFINIDNVGGSSQDADYERLGGGIKATYELANLAGNRLGLIGGAEVRQIDWLSVEQTGFGGFGGLGLTRTLDNHFEFLAEARYTFDPLDEEGPLGDDQYYHWSIMAGVRYKVGQWPPPAPDADRDGVPDSLDECPNTPEGAAVNPRGCPFDTDADGVPDYKDKCPNTPDGVLVDADGCPLDSDNDGVIDPLDRCPDTPEGVPVDAQGCPQDSDQDGVVDARDLCPNTPLGAEVDVNGCPFDTDQDGVPDFRDDCPNTPYGVPVNERGCSRDNDGDGVENAIDQCPNTFPGLEVDQVGCPIRNQVLTLHNVHFQLDKAELQPDSRTLLRKVATSLLDQPLLRIEVAGHTDSTGSEAYNLQLSVKRANAVRRFLIQQGVPADNIEAVGYGESRPIAENTTEDGRAQNRRVEIHLQE